MTVNSIIVTHLSDTRAFFFIDLLADTYTGRKSTKILCQFLSFPLTINKSCLVASSYSLGQYIQILQNILYVLFLEACYKLTWVRANGILSTLNIDRSVLACYESTRVRSREFRHFFTAQHNRSTGTLLWALTLDNHELKT